MERGLCGGEGWDIRQFRGMQTPAHGRQWTLGWGGICVRTGREVYVPLRRCILLIPIIDMPQFIMWIIFKRHRTHGAPLRMFLRNPLLCYTSQFQLLTLPQLTYYRPVSVRVVNNWRSAGCAFRHSEVPCVDGDVCFTRAFCVQSQCHGALFAVGVARAVAVVDEFVVHLGGVEGD